MAYSRWLRCLAVILGALSSIHIFYFAFIFQSSSVAKSSLPRKRKANSTQATSRRSSVPKIPPPHSAQEKSSADEATELRKLRMQGVSQEDSVNLSAAAQEEGNPISEGSDADGFSLEKDAAESDAEKEEDMVEEKETKSEADSPENEEVEEKETKNEQTSMEEEGNNVEEKDTKSETDSLATQKDMVEEKDTNTEPHSLEEKADMAAEKITKIESDSSEKEKEDTKSEPDALEKEEKIVEEKDAKSEAKENVAGQTQGSEGVENEASTKSESQQLGPCGDIAKDSKTMRDGVTHVVYAADRGQARAVQASIASVVVAASSPESLVIHVLTLDSSAAQFRDSFGFPQGCRHLRLTTGTKLLVHEFEASTVSPSVAKVPEWIRKARGKLDSPLNYVRFYLHTLLRDHVGTHSGQVITYLDTDVIVNGDIKEISSRLTASGKTVGFVKRPSANSAPADKFLATPPKQKPWCGKRSKNWHQLLKGHTYNVGVFTVNLQRWADFKLTSKVEKLVKEHNECDGSLWIGGSQPPMLLAVLESASDTSQPDFIEYESIWNLGDLGWRENMNEKKIAGAKVLHWTGTRKPWKDKGLYRSWWMPHLEGWQTLLPPSLSSSAIPAVSSSEASARETVTPDKAGEKPVCKLMLEHGAASTDGSSKPKLCNQDQAWTCSENAEGLYVQHGCHGLFLIQKLPTICLPTSDLCEAGFLPKPSSQCGIMIVSTYFVGIKDWQRAVFQKIDFAKIKKFYYTTGRLGLNVTILHDKLPDNFVAQWTSNLFHFEKVDLKKYANTKLGVNDVRYFHFMKAIQNHPEWKYIFILDAFDVLVKMNPCSFVQPGKLYVGSEPTSLKRNSWLRIRFSDMGGEYMKWYTKQQDPARKTLNCGITGGQREIILKLFSRMESVFRDEKLKVRKKGKEINVNMAALNYVVYSDFSDVMVTGAPIHSRYWQKENHREDVWFIHK